MKHIGLVLIGSLVASAALLVACSDDDSSSKSGEPVPEETTGGTSQGGAPSSTGGTTTDTGGTSQGGAPSTTGGTTTDTGGTTTGGESNTGGTTSNCGETCAVPAALNQYYSPSGWMGDLGLLTMDVEGAPCDVDRPAGAVGDCYMVVVDPAGSTTGDGWAGIYWLHPENNWGPDDGTPGLGCDFSDGVVLSFKVRGAVGGESINTFGGGTPDRLITLSDTWTEYTIDLTTNPSCDVWGAFGFSLPAPSSAITFYIDDVHID